MRRPPRFIDPETLLAAQRAYETGEPVAAIAERLDITEKALRSRADRGAWRRKARRVKKKPTKRKATRRVAARDDPQLSGAVGTTIARSASCPDVFRASATTAAQPGVDGRGDPRIESGGGDGRGAARRGHDGPKVRDGSGTGTTPGKIAGKTKKKKPGRRVSLVRRLRSTVEKEIASAERLLAESSTGEAQVERAARTLASLVRTLRELNALDAPSAEPKDEEPPRDLDAFRRELAARLDRLRAERDGPPAGEPFGSGDRDVPD